MNNVCNRENTRTSGQVSFTTPETTLFAMNNTTLIPKSLYGLSDSSTTFLLCINGIAVLIGTLANALVMVAVFVAVELRTATNLCLGSLSAGDLLTCAVFQPIFMHSIALDTLTVANKSVSILAVYLSLNGLVNVTVERYVAIFFPYHYIRWMALVHIYVIIAFSWVIAIFANILYVLGVTSEFVGYSYIFIVAFLLIVVYAKIYLTARKQNQIDVHFQSNDVNLEQDALKQARRRALESKTTMSIGMIIGIFLICWLPFMISPAFVGKNTSYTQIYPWVNTFALLNSCGNPFLYFWKFPKFRSSLMEIVRH